MSEIKDQAMLALLPTTSEWCNIALPHLTLVYAGRIRDRGLKDFNELAKDAVSIAALAPPIHLKVLGTEIFGPVEDRVDVFRLEATPDLLAMRRVVEGWNESEYPFSPHVTIGPAGHGQSLEFPPLYLSFDRMMVAWGSESLTFWLRR